VTLISSEQIGESRRYSDSADFYQTAARATG
jgi:hypothetical protein